MAFSLVLWLQPTAVSDLVIMKLSVIYCAGIQRHLNFSDSDGLEYSSSTPPPLYSTVHYNIVFDKTVVYPIWTPTIVL